MSVERIVYDRGPYASFSAGGARVAQALPEPGSVIEISIDRSVDPVVGGMYAALVVRNPIEGLWQSRLLLDAGNEYRPVSGTPEGVVADLEAIMRPGESRLDALVAFTVEFADTLNARVERGIETTGPRLESIHERDATALEKNPEAEAARRAAIPAEGRQLPGLLDDASPELASALGLAEWAPWTVVVRYDEKTTENYQWVALLVDGVGFLGPTELAPGQVLTGIDGYGPSTASVSVMLWPEGIPREVLPASSSDPQVVDATIRKTGFVISSDERKLLDAGAALVVDLRGDRTTISVVGSSELDEMLAEFSDPGELSEGSDES